MLLTDTPFMIPWHQQHVEIATIRTSHSATSHGARDFFNAIRDVYTCDCTAGHVIGVGCWCISCSQPLASEQDLHESIEWELSVACPTDTDTGTDTPNAATILLKTVPQNESIAPTIEDLCSLVQEAAMATIDSVDQEVVINPLDTNHLYRMKVIKLGTTESEPPTVRYFNDLIKPGNDLSPKDKFEIALKLSRAIEQLCQTEWVDDSWDWKNVIVCIRDHSTFGFEPAYSPLQTAGDPPEKSTVTSIYLLREMYSPTGAGAVQRLNSPHQAVSQILVSEPILAKLGLALIELAFGRPIQEIRADLKLEAKYPEIQAADDDDDLSNYLTASALLKDHKICEQAGMMYEKVVNVCIKGEYDDWDGRRKRVESGNGSFTSCFNEAIVKPLLRVCRWYEG